MTAVSPSSSGAHLPVHIQVGRGAAGGPGAGLGRQPVAHDGCVHRRGDQHLHWAHVGIEEKVPAADSTAHQNNGIYSSREVSTSADKLRNVQHSPKRLDCRLSSSVVLDIQGTIRPATHQQSKKNNPHAAGFEDEGAKEMMRLYQTIHTDHEVHCLALQQTCCTQQQVHDDRSGFVIDSRCLFCSVRLNSVRFGSVPLLFCLHMR